MKLYETLQEIFGRNRTTKEKSIGYEDAKGILKNNTQAILLDVRSEQEYRENHLDGSINYPLYDLQRNSKSLIWNKHNTIIIYCQSGSRSKKAMKILEQEGYKNVYEIKGGLDEI